MLIELWERLRGYDKWMQVEARIESSTIERSRYIRKGTAYCDFASRHLAVWIDSRGRQQRAEFKVDDRLLSDPFKRRGTETIRYDPQRPERFYSRDLLRTRVRKFLELALYATIVILVVVVVPLTLFFFVFSSRR
jgi:hypothetical protein